MYDEIDMQSHYNTGFWVGVAAGSVVTFMLCLLVGVYIT